MKRDCFSRPFRGRTVGQGCGIMEGLERRVLLTAAPTPMQAVKFDVSQMTADPVRNVMYVVDATDAKVLAVDMQQGRTATFGDLPSGPVTGLAVSPDGSRLFVLEEDARQIQTFFLPDLKPGPTIPLGFAAWSIAIGSQNRLYVAGSSTSSSQLTQIDAGTGQILGSFGTGFIYDPMLKTSTDGNTLYAFNRGISTVPSAIGMYDVTGGQTPVPETGYTVVQANGIDFAVDDVYHRLYTSNGGDYGVGVTDEATNTLTLWKPASQTPYGVAVALTPGGSSVYGATASEITQYDRATGAITGDYSTGGSDSEIFNAALQVTPDGRVLFAARQTPVANTDLIGEIGGPGTVVIDDVPAARFTLQPGAAAGQYLFDATTSEPFRAGETIASYAWNFGDGATATGATPAHAFLANGTYNVQLTVTSSTGISNTQLAKIVVGGLPVTGPTLGSDGTLTVTGTSGNDAIALAYVPASSSISVNFDGVVSTFPYSGVARIVVNGLGGDDSLTLDSILYGNVTYDGGPGNNSVVYNGTQGDDTITVNGSQVADPYVTLAYSNVQSLRVNGNFGYDTITASGALPAHTTLDGGDGNDIIRASATTTPVSIFGGTGDDRIFARNGVSDTISGGGGIDYAQTDPFDVVSGITPVGLTGLSVVAEGSIYSLAIAPPTTADYFSYVVDWGDGTPDYVISGNALTIPHLYDDGPATRTITVYSSDSFGSYDPSTLTVAVTNVAPQPFIQAPAQGVEGSPIAVTAGATDPSAADAAAGFAYAWNVAKDGNPFASGTGAAFNFTPDDNGTYVVNLSATDKDGGVGVTSKTIPVLNAAPTPSFSTPFPTGAMEGAPVTLTCSATDPSPVDTAAGFTYGWTVTKGGISVAGGSGPTLTFTPDDDGYYFVSLSATDKDGSTATVGQTFYVYQVVASPVLSLPASSPEGKPITLKGATVGATPADAAAGFTYAWEVTKNGNPFVTGAGPTFTFTPDDNGSYFVTEYATDRDGETAFTGQSLPVTNVAPTAAITGPSIGHKGKSTSFNLFATDPSAADTAAGFTFVVDWNDGTTQSPVGPSGLLVNHTFKRSGTYTLKVYAIDKDGAAGPAVLFNVRIV